MTGAIAYFAVGIVLAVCVAWRLRHGHPVDAYNAIFAFLFFWPFALPMALFLALHSYFASRP